MKLAFILLLLPILVLGQNNTVIKGTIYLLPDSSKAKYVDITLVQQQKTVQSDSNGVYCFENIPAGIYSFSIGLNRYIPFLSENFSALLDTVTLPNIYLHQLPFGLSDLIVSDRSQNNFIFSSPKFVDKVYIDNFVYAASLNEILSKTPGYQYVYNNYSESKILFNGINGSTTLTLDNMRIFNENLGLISQIFPTSLISAIEFNNQTSPDFLGSGASLGSINLISKKDSPDKIGIKLHFSKVGENDYNLSMNKKVGRLSAKIDSLNTYISVGKKLNQFNEASYTNPKRTGDYLYGVFDLGYLQNFNSAVSIFYLASNFEYYLPPQLYGFYYYPPYIKSISYFSTQINTKYSFSDEKGINLKIQYAKNKTVSNTNTVNSNIFSSQLVYSNKINNSVNYETGFESTISNFNFNNSASALPYNYETSLFLNSSVSFRNFTTNLSLRTTNYKENLFLFTPALNILINTGTKTRFKIGYVIGYNLPNALYNFPGINYTNNDTYYSANNNLKPQITQTFLLGFIYTDFDFYSLNLNIYRSKITNITGYNYQGGSEINISPTSSGFVNSTAAEISLKLSLYKNLNVKISYSFSSSTDINGNLLLYRIPTIINMFADYSIPKLDLSAQLNVNWYDKKKISYYQTFSDLNKFYGDNPQYTIPDYFMVNFSISKKIFSSLAISLGAKNLLNKIIESPGYYMEREYFIEIRY